MAHRAFCLLIALVFSVAACQGQSRDKLMQQGSELLSKGNPKGAVVVFKSLLEKYPGDVPASLALVKAYLDSGKAQQAEAELKAIQEKVKDNSDIPVLMARILIAQQKPADALDALKPVLGESAPAAALEQAGNASLILGDVKEAMSFYRDATNKDSKLLTARLGLAECQSRLNQPADARATLEELLRVDAKNKVALYLLAQFQSLAGEEDAVLETYGQIVKYYPSEVSAAYREAFLRLTRKKEVAFAETVAAKLLKAAPSAPEGFKLKGLVLLANNQAPLAIEPLLTANKIRPDLDTNLFLAQVYAQAGNLETAVSHLQVVLSRNPGIDEARRMLANIYLHQNRLDEAIAETQKLFAKSPSDEASQMIMADAFIAKHDYEKGLEIFTRMAEGNDTTPALYLKRGLLLAMRGKDSEAEPDLRKAVELGGKALEPRLYLSTFLAGKNRVDEAVEVLGADMDSGPNAALAMNAMAKLRLIQGRLDDAYQLLDTAKKTAPKLLATYYNLAALAAASGKLDKAAAEFQQALTVNENDLRSLLGAASCQETLGNIDQARDMLLRAAKEHNPKATIALAEFQIRRSDTSKALAALDEGLTATPREIPLWILKARLLAAEGNQEKALSSLDRIETLNQRQGLLEKAKFFLSRKENDKAIEIAKRLRSMNVNSGDYSLPLAEILESQGQIDNARNTLRDALTSDPNNVRVLAAMARLEARDKQPEKALSLAGRIIDSNLDPAGGHTLKGTILHQFGDTAKAAEEYETALLYNQRLLLALNNLAMIYADDDSATNKALELAIRAYSLEPNNASVLDTLGYALLRNGRSKEAVAALEHADELARGNADIAKHLEMARAALPEAGAATN